MWPFSDMSLSAATLVGTLANWMLLASLLGGVLSTFVIVKTADVKEEHWANDRRESSEKVVVLTTQGDQLRKDTAEANARAAEATLKANEADLARLKLEERLAPRRIRQKDQELIASQVSEFRGQVGQIGSSPREFESIRLESALHAALSMGGWKITHGVPTHTSLGGGVMIASTEDPRSQAAAYKLASVLNGLGIFAIAGPMLAFEPKDAGDPTRIFITIGSKPEPDDLPPPAKK